MQVCIILVLLAKMFISNVEQVGMVSLVLCQSTKSNSNYDGSINVWLTNRITSFIKLYLRPVHSKIYSRTMVHQTIMVVMYILLMVLQEHHRA
jgi:hypothetical protein